MKIYGFENYKEMSNFAGTIIAQEVKKKPNLVLGLATGSTPIGTYEKLIEIYKEGNLDFSKVKTVNLDEYQGLNKDHHQSYYYYMLNNLFSHINIDLKNVHIPNGIAENEKEECENYDSILEKLNYQDLQILGIGENGHIGFNEPNSVYTKNTYCVELTESTRMANSVLFENKAQVPTHAYTMGIKSIMSAKKILLLVSGVKKAQVLKEALLGEITPNIPASILQLSNNLTVLGDREALSYLNDMVEYK